MTPRMVLEPGRLAGAALLGAQSDARLVDLVRAGHPAAFEAIVRRYRAPLLRYVGGLLPSPRAEDAVQQALLRAYQAMRDDRRPLDLRPWLYRIAHNTALNALRERGWDHAELDNEHDGVERPEDVAIRRESLADTVAAVQALPERQRASLVLRELEGRSHEEIARELGVTGGAVRQLINRARTTLRAGATALTPAPLVRVAAEAGPSTPVAERAAELVAGAGASAVALKAGAALLATGAVVGGVAQMPLVSDDDARSQPPAQIRADDVSDAVRGLPADPRGRGTETALLAAGASGRALARRVGAAPAGSGSGGDRRGRGEDRGSSGSGRDGSGDDDPRGGDGGDDDRSGPGGGFEAGDDSSGPGGGEVGSGGDDGVGSSGPGGGGLSSGEGSGSDDGFAPSDGGSGSGSSGGGSGSGRDRTDPAPSRADRGPIGARAGRDPVPEEGRAGPADRAPATATERSPAGIRRIGVLRSSLS